MTRIAPSVLRADGVVVAGASVAVPAPRSIAAVPLMENPSKETPGTVPLIPTRITLLASTTTRTVVPSS